MLTWFVILNQVTLKNMYDLLVQNNGFLTITNKNHCLYRILYSVEIDNMKGFLRESIC